MFKSSLIDLFKTFTVSELNRFDSFIRSPYYNKSKITLKLFLTIKKFAPLYTDEGLDKKKIWSKIFPGKNFSYTLMKNHIHNLTSLGMKFLAAEYLEKHKLYEDDMLMEELLYRNKKTLFSQKYKKLNSSFSGRSIKDLQLESDEYYRIAGKLFWQNTYFEKVNNIKLPSDSELKLGSSYSTYSYIIGLIKQYNNIIACSYEKNYDPENNLAVVVLKELSSGIFEKVLKWAKINSDKDYRILDTYIALNNALIKIGDEKAYYVFKKKLTENFRLFSFIELKELFNCLSTALSHIVHRENDVLKEFVENLDLMSELNILTNENGNLNSIYYYFYIIASYRLLRFKKIESFSVKFLNKITEDKIENADLFTKALLAFGNNKYDEALKLILKTEYVALFQKFFVREFRASCLYELNEPALFEYEFKSLYHFLKNNDLENPRLIKSVSSHMKFVKKMFRLRENFKEKAFTKLADKIPENNIWLSQKVTELGKINGISIFQ